MGDSYSESESRAEGKGPAGSKLLLCTLCCPWPDRPEQGLYNQEYAASLQRVGVNTTLFAPGPPVPTFLGQWQRLRPHASRPLEYRLDDVRVLAPRIPFAFPGFVREASRGGASTLVSRAFGTAVRRHLNAAIEATQPTALLLHGAHPWGRIGGEVASAHGISAYIVEHSADDLVRAAQRASLGKLYRDANGQCAGWITVSDSMRELLQRVVPDAKVAVIGNGARRLTEPPPRPAELDGQTIIFAAAHYYRRKGFEELIQAFKEASLESGNLRLFIATDAPPELRNAVGEIGEHAHLLGPLSHKDVLKWMHWSDVFALPSRAEAFGIVYAEALCAGTPVILATDCGLAPSLRLLDDEPAREGFDGWSVSLDRPGALRAALRHAARGAALLGEMGASAKGRAIPRFDWTQTARSVADSMGLVYTAR